MDLGKKEQLKAGLESLEICEPSTLSLGPVSLSFPVCKR